LIVLRTLLWVAGLLACAGVVSWFHSERAGLLVLAGGLLILLLYHTVYLSRVTHWAGLPRQRDLPAGVGSWGVMLERLGRYMRAEAIERGDTASELERLHAAVDLLPDGLVVLDRFDHVQWSNRAAQELHGIFGRRRPIDHFIRQPEFIGYLQAGDFSRPVMLSLPSAPARSFALKIVPTVDAYRLLITRDVTESSRLEQMRRDFVANVSHEIRTPLTVVAGFVETLLDMDDLPPDERRRCLGMVQRQTATMQRLVEDLLTLSSLENATQPGELQALDVGVLLQQLAADTRALSAGRHQVDVLADLPAALLATPSELDSAVRNLLTNAVRYTPEGGRIVVGWQLREGDGVLWVRDSGIGIAPEHLPRLTERFYRVDRGRSRDIGGTGLGLAIVKHVAQRHQARLEIDSRVGQGSTFTLRFPASRLRPAPDTAAAGTSRGTLSAAA
jgi:two-component system phosphate regulon sensor histidine kinase PhoR